MTTLPDVEAFGYLVTTAMAAGLFIVCAVLVLAVILGSRR